MHHFGSVEGRDASPAPKIGSLGGDLGEWLLGLAAYEAVKNEARGHDERGNRLPRISLQWWQVRWVRRQLLAGACAAAPSHAAPSRSGQVEWWLFVHLFLCRLWHPERKLSFSHVTDEARLQARSPSPHPPTRPSSLRPHQPVHLLTSPSTSLLHLHLRRLSATSTS